MGFYDAALFLCPWDIIGFYCFKYHFFRRYWSLLIFCHFGESIKSETRTPCMLLLDSLEKANPRRLEPDIRKYVCQNLPPCVGIIVYSMFWFIFFISFRFVLDIYKAEGRLETKDFIYQIPLLVPKVIINTCSWLISTSILLFFTCIYIQNNKKVEFFFI